MEETVESRFTVQDVVNDDIWLKDLNRGLTVAVEASSPHYSSTLDRQIQSLSTGETINAELRSQNRLRTIWVFDKIDLDREGERNRATV